MPDQNEYPAHEIAALARKYWEEEGRPDHRAGEHWARAVRELGEARARLSIPAETASEDPPASAPTPAEPAETPLTVPPSTFPARSLVVKRRDGLGARMLAFLRAWRFARQLGAGVRLLWPSLDHRGREERLGDEGLDALLDLQAMRTAGRLHDFVLVDRDAVPADNGCLEKLPISTAGMRAGFTADAVFASGPLIECGAQRACHVAGETAAQVQAGLVALFDSLIIHPAIQAARDDFRAAMGGRPFAVLHVRRGEILADTITFARGKAAGLAPADATLAGSRIATFLQRCPPTWALLAEVNRLAPELPVLVLGDSRNRIAEVQAMLGAERLVTLPVGRAALRPAQRAFLDLLLIRDAAVVVGGQSAFVSFPTETGHGRLSTVGPETDPDAWLAGFEAEVLDPAEVPAEARPSWRELYRERWNQAATQQAAIRKREKRAKA